MGLFGKVLVMRLCSYCKGAWKAIWAGGEGGGEHSHHTENSFAKEPDDQEQEKGAGTIIKHLLWTRRCVKHFPYI